MLPAWIPGSYMIREFARNIVRISALADGRRVALKKIGKHTWRAAPAKQVELAYRCTRGIYGARGASGETQGFFNGTSCSARWPGNKTCIVDILPPAGTRYCNWRVATALTPARGTRRLAFGTYEAVNYDELIDCPVEMGDFQLGRFSVLDVPHEVVITGRVPKLDMPRLTIDLARLCETQVRFFEPRSHKPPFERYTFLTMALGRRVNGGLAPRKLDALLQARRAAVGGMTESTEPTATFSGLRPRYFMRGTSKIRPAAFVQYDLSRENPTR